MPLLTLKEISLRFGGLPLLDAVTLHIEPGERICLLGRNGTGKSSLLKVIHGELEIDAGEVVSKQGMITALLPQEVPQDLTGRIFDVAALGSAGASNDADALRRIDAVLSQMNLDPERRVEILSAGMKRRVLLAQALVRRPDLLLLDEPTNHLDIRNITWLEEFLARFEGAILFVTHDRLFLRKVARRILDLDRGALTSWDCDYDTFLERKEMQLAAEEKSWAREDRKLAQEETWIRQGIMARRTRNEGRVRALKRLREERRARRDRIGKVRMHADSAERSGRLVIEAENVTCNHGGASPDLFTGFSAMIMRGDRVGIIGPNGSGKTSLLRVLLKKIVPDAGRVRLGTNLDIAYFDQLREQLDENKSVADNVSNGNTQVTINGKSRHILGYLGDFLFSPDRARSPVSFLSGGERNRLLLARLFTRPSNLLVLDEPTNDLDAETLELLESLLHDYEGTVLLVSHDRAFLNNVVTSTLVFEKPGRVNEYAGGYDDWLMQRDAKSEEPEATKPASKAKKKNEPARRKRERKLGYNEKRELERLPTRIEAMETEREALHEVMGDPAFFRKEGAEIAQLKSRLEKLDKDLEAAYRRWEELEELDH